MEKKERAKDLRTLQAFCNALSENCPDLVVDLSLFNYKTPERPKVRQAVRKNIPMAEVFWSILDLLEDYERGEDILWRPAYDIYTTDRTRLVNFIWLDDFNADILPWIEVKTSENKSQAYFLLSKPVQLEVAEAIQKKLARTMGDKGAGSFVQHRRFPGLVNGKYDHEPLCMMIGPFEEGVIDPEEIIKDTTDTQENIQETTEGAGGGVSVEKRLIKTLNLTAYVKDRSAFENEKGDQSAIDFAWALSMARTLINKGWSDDIVAMTIMWELLTKSPEVRKRKKTLEHLRDYVIRTTKKAIDTVKGPTLDFLDL